MAGLAGDPEIIFNLGGPILFTAPHSLNIVRGGKVHVSVAQERGLMRGQDGERKRIHKREKFSSEIVLKLAAFLEPYLGKVLRAPPPPPPPPPLCFFASSHLSAMSSRLRVGASSRPPISSGIAWWRGKETRGILTLTISLRSVFASPYSPCPLKHFRLLPRHLVHAIFPSPWIFIVSHCMCSSPPSLPPSHKRPHSSLP